MRYFIALAFLAVSLNAQTIPPVVVSDVLSGSVNGVPQVGSINISWNIFTDINGNTHPSGSQTVYVSSNGRFSVSLVPNAGATPNPSYYTVTYSLSGGTTLSDVWLVPVTTKTLTIAQVRANQNLPPPPFLMNLSQINCLTCAIGSVPTWNGASLEMLPFRSLFVGTFTTDSGFHVAFSAATHGQGPNIIPKFYDTSGNELTPSVTVDPITGDLNAYFNAATSGKVLIDGGQAIPNFAAGFYSTTTAVIPESQHHFASPNLYVAVYDSNGNLISSSVTIQVDPVTYAVTVTASSPINMRVIIMGGLGTAIGSGVNASAFGGIGLKAGTPTNGQIWAYNSTDNLWELAAQSGGGGGSGNATSMQGVAISATAPTVGQAYVYNSVNNDLEPVAVNYWKKYTVSYTQLTGFGSTGTVTLFARANRQKICGVTVFVTTGLTGGSLSAVTATVGDSNATPNLYTLNPVDVRDNGAQDFSIMGSGTSSSNVTATFTAVGANLSALTAGSVDIDVCSVNQP